MNTIKNTVLLIFIFTITSSFSQIKIDRQLTENKTNPIGLDIESQLHPLES